MLLDLKKKWKHQKECWPTCDPALFWDPVHARGVLIAASTKKVKHQCCLHFARHTRWKVWPSKKVRSTFAITYANVTSLSMTFKIDSCHRIGIIGKRHLHYQISWRGKNTHLFPPKKKDANYKSRLTTLSKIDVYDVWPFDNEWSTFTKRSTNKPIDGNSCSS